MKMETAIFDDKNLRGLLDFKYEYVKDERIFFNEYMKCEKIIVDGKEYVNLVYYEDTIIFPKLVENIYELNNFIMNLYQENIDLNYAGFYTYNSNIEKELEITDLFQSKEHFLSKIEELKIYFPENIEKIDKFSKIQDCFPFP